MDSSDHVSNTHRDASHRGDTCRHGGHRRRGAPWDHTNSIAPARARRPSRCHPFAALCLFSNPVSSDLSLGSLFLTSNPFFDLDTFHQ